MRYRARNEDRPSTGGGAGGVRRSRERVVRAVALVALLAALGAGGTAAATAATSPPGPPPTTPSPDPSAAPAPRPAPTVEAPVFSTDGAVAVTGTRPSGVDVQVTIASVPAAVTLPSPTTWRATATGVPDGQSPVRVTAGGQEATATASVLRAPRVNSFSVVTTGLVSGTGFPGATVDARSGSAACRATVGASSTWACLLAPPPPSGTAVPVTATQTTSWSTGAPAVGRGTGSFDTTAPGAAVITAPAAGATVDATGITISGTSDEDGTTVRAYLSGYGDAACQAQVAGGRWSCTTGTLPPGPLGITATVTDPLGNISVLAREVRVTIQAPATAPTPGATPTPGTPTPEPSRSPEGATAAPAPGSGGGGGSAPGAGPSPEGAPGAGAAPRATAPGTWNAPTRFGTSLQPLPAAFTDGRGLLPLLLALGAVLLVTLPALLLRGALISRFGGRHRTSDDVTPLRIVARGDAGALTTRAAAAAFTESTATTGQMRIVPGTLDSAPLPVPARREPEPTLLGTRPAHEPGRARRWGAAAAALALAAALASLSLPVGSDPNAVRLFLAALAGLAVVNLVGVVAVAAVAGPLGAGPARVRAVPALLVLSATAVLVSRGFGLAPPVVIGQVLGLVADDRDDRSRARLALVQSGSLAALGLVAWILYGLVPATGGMWWQMANELLSTVTLASLSSAALALAPVSLVLGRSLLLRSLPLWAVTSVVVLTLAFAAVATTASGVPAGVWITSLVVAAAFAAVSLAVWLWIRVVEPSVQRS
ncbi:hypothetical protein [Clavibacter zhangzhiyongii]|uniref:Bacterial Ig-like domain-containing protein n=1 Tax=Clavibacter zhangzhiyongii TaxID=2768071 RepID=A0A7L7Z0F3_9MICO|nr:hypothetical protein [Clavibacter zhangzhiyongii]QOD43193.1 hypothetical protein H9X71_11350 [Clavibacter zhangzhiyongii]